MPHHCYVPSCTQNSKAGVDGRPVSFRSFPRDQALRKKWIVKIRWDEGTSCSINDSAKVCSVHFTDDCFSEETRRRPEEKVTTIAWRNLKRLLYQLNFFWTSEFPAKRKAPAQRLPLPEPKRARHGKVLAAGEEDVQKDLMGADSDSDAVARPLDHECCACVPILQARLDDLSAEAGHSKQAEAPRHIFSIEQISLLTTTICS